MTRKEPGIGVGGEVSQSRCKGPKAGMNLVCRKKSRKARVAERDMCVSKQLRTQAPDDK